MFKSQRGPGMALMSSAPRQAIATTIVLVFISQLARAAVYPVDVERNLNGLKIIDQVTRLEVGNASVLSLTNASTETADCRIIFDPRIQQRKTARRKIGPGETSTVHYAAGRAINRLMIVINCKPL